MTKIVRNTSTAASQAFWESAKQTSVEVKQWPSWRRAGINVSPTRATADAVRGGDGRPRSPKLK